ncbi:MAG: hypothetical protein HC840_13325, partial [Leptolyngbyaceae cyanobacterium RM2_2_4]|nr:hypothetical protein [Leptolyngbyaceae cyanobacterium RM2_2_4]
TSFLQAGILPRLSTADATHRGVYVRLGGQDPVRAIASALSITLEIPLDWLQTEPNSAGFHKLLDTAFKAAEKPLILFLDQFEQFFVYYSREEQRHPFVQALKVWYTSPQPLPVSLVVAVRSDLLYQLDELHKALGYALGPQEVFRLEKFTPTETVNVLKAIAHLEHLSFDARFVTELAEAELANREDGRISPVDVQILAWMIEQQPQGELRAFDRNAFQKFGGVEGLLQRFLERTLDARMLPNQRQSALKVLLALTDLDRQVRAGVLSVNELVAKLKDTVSADEVAEAVKWLARGDVRLITPQEREGVVGYELAHERLIPALLRQTQKELTDVERARQLLDRRVNEWLGNQRDSRYFFNFRELWLIRKQRPYIDWSAKREQKETLIRRSQRRVYGRLAVVLLLISLVGGVGGWLRFTPSGQLQVMYWPITFYASGSVSNVIAAGTVFAKNEQWAKAFNLVQTHLHPTGTPPSPSQDAAMVRFIGEATDLLIKSTLPKDKQIQQFQRLVKFAQTIQDDGSKSNALRAIATASVQLEDEATAAELLNAALTSAQTIQDDRYKSDALREIAATSWALGDVQEQQSLLDAVQEVAQRGRHGGVILEMVLLYAKQEQWNRALSLLRGYGNVDTFAELLTIRAESRNPKLIDGAVVLQAVASGNPGSYILETTIQSDDQSCEQRADWWEITTLDGELIARQVLDTAHREEQPFTSQRDSVNIAADQEVLIRAHFHNDLEGSSGYSDQALQGSVEGGFKSVRLSPRFAGWLESEEPQPGQCAE